MVCSFGLVVHIAIVLFSTWLRHCGAIMTKWLRLLNSFAILLCVRVDAASSGRKKIL